MAEGEVRYRATLDQQPCLVREAPLKESQGLRWEQATLQNGLGPVLPELLDVFEHQEHFYLVTSFPQGIRLDQKLALKGLNESGLLAWARTLHEVLRKLAAHELHLDLSPECLVKTQSGQLRLLDLRATVRSPGHPAAQPASDGWARDLMGLGRCLEGWAAELEVSPETRQLIQGLLAGRAGPWLESQPVESGEACPGRVPLEDGSRLTCLAPGSRLAGYELTYHTRGGMSLCYLGRLGNDVRFLKEVKADGGEAAQALRREFEIMKGLKHPHIVRAHQTFELGGYLYLVLDYIEGSSLAGLTRPEAEPPPEQRLLEWALQLCEALHYLHSQKPPLIYRDLKPANIVLSGECLFLIDFGLARTYKVGQAQDTQALGTFSTASPEHFSGQTDARSDIYSLGATLYLLAHPGFKPTAPFSFPSLRKARPAYSESFEKLVHKCLTHSPEERWPNTRALAAELGKLLEPYRKNRQAVSSGPDPNDVRFVPNLTSHVAAQARQLSTLVGQGAALPQALETLASQCGIPALAEVWRQVGEGVRKGQTLSAACQQHPRVFPASYLKSVGHGDASGLARGAEVLEKEDLARCTRAAPAADTNPFGETEPPVGRLQRRLVLVALVVLSLGLGLGVTYGLRYLGSRALLNGAGVSLGVAVVAIFVSGIRDARLLRVQGKARNLVEDAWTSHALGETEKAEQELSKALLLARDRLGVNHLTTLASLHSLANLCRQKRVFDKAAAYYQQAEQIYNRTLPANHPSRAHLHYHWALNYEGQKNIPQALEQLGHSVAIWNKHAAKHPLELAEVLFNEGRIYFDQEEFDKAADRFSQSLELQYGKLGLKSPLVHQTMSYLTRSYVKLRLFKESEPHLASLLVEVEQDLDPNYAALAEANLDMGLIRLEEQRTLEAEPYFLRALQLLQHYVGPNDRLLKRALDGYRRIFGPLPEQAGAVQLVSVFMGEREKIRQTMEKHPEWINARDNTGWGPIQWATFMGRDDIVRWLLDRGADPGYDASHVMGPLHVACAWDRTDAMLTLLERDPDVNATGPGGWTPVFWCSLTGRVRLLESLLKRSANVRAQDDNGRTPLHVAASRNHLKVVAALIGAGAEVNAREPGTGSTPLHHAAQRGHLAVCDCLIYNGAQLSLKDGAGQTPLDLAVRNQHKLLVRALRKHSQEGLGKAAKG